jgi:hypothetical protein
MREKSLLDSVKLAQLANGGTEFNYSWCQCDPDVGAVPCQYCAIYDALSRVKWYLQERVVINDSNRN